MTTIHFTIESSLPPGTIVDALTDFSERRPSLWLNLDQRFYQVHDQGDTWADVTEGSSFLGGVWEHDRYDWSTPGVVRIMVIDSNAFARGSFWEYRVQGTANGASRVEATIHRAGKNLKGRVVALLLGLFGRRVFVSDFQKALAQIERAQPTSVDERAPAQQPGTLPQER